MCFSFFFFFSSRRRHTRLQGDWSSDVCSSDLGARHALSARHAGGGRTASAADRAASRRAASLQRSRRASLPEPVAGGEGRLLQWARPLLVRRAERGRPSPAARPARFAAVIWRTMRRLAVLVCAISLPAFAYNEAIHALITRRAFADRAAWMSEPLPAPTQADLDAFRGLFWRTAAQLPDPALRAKLLARWPKSPRNASRSAWVGAGS